MGPRRSTSPFALAIGALAWACGGDDLTLPNEGVPAEVEIFGGDRQNGTVGELLGDSLVVEVTDRFGSPVAGVTVTWSAEGGGSVDPTESVTAADGRAGTQRILGPQPSTYFTVATVEGIPDPVTFTSTGLTARLAITSVVPAIASSGVPLSPQPTLRLEDADGTPIAREGVVVTVQIASGGGSLTGATSATSNADGQVAFTDVAIRGSPGTRRLIFAGDAFAPATTPPIALGVGAPASIEGVAGDDQSAMVGDAVPVDPAVLVRDADGNPLDGIPVTFTVTSGAGKVSDNTSVTGADGIAAVGSWTLGSTAGENTLSAAVAGQDLSGSPVVFAAIAVPGAVSPQRSTVMASPGSIGASNGSNASTITVTVRDQFDNPIPGVEVTLVVSGGSGNSLVQPSAATNTAGIATGQFSSTDMGERTISATAAGIELQQTAAVTVGPGIPSAANSSATVPNGQAGAATTIQVRLNDAFGHPVPGARGSIGVTIAGRNPRASINITDQGGGLYHVQYTPLVSGDDSIDLRVGGAPIPGTPFRSVVAPGPVSPSHSTATINLDENSFYVVIVVVVTARDAQGNPVGRGGEMVLASVDNDDDPRVAEDLGNGTYRAVLLSFSDEFTVEVEMNGIPIQGSPFRFSL